jgi:hypothetical protein
MGSKAFGTFAKAYIQNFKFATATSGDFKAFFIDFFTNVWDPYPAAPVPTAPPVEVYPSGILSYGYLDIIIVIISK